jgi:hypothetical protein
VGESAVPAPQAQPSAALLTSITTTAVEASLLSPGADLEKTAGSAPL